MIHKHLFAVALLLYSVFSFGQESFPAQKLTSQTESWDFICENYALTGKAAIQISKTEKGGNLNISIATTDPSYYVGGVVYVFLDDYSIIVCTDKGIRKSEKGIIAAQYTFTVSEMSKLRKTDIASIRFNIRGNQKTFGSQTGNFTAVNKKTYFSTTENKIQTYETASQINSLYKI